MESSRSDTNSRWWWAWKQLGGFRTLYSQTVNTSSPNICFIFFLLQHWNGMREGRRGGGGDLHALTLDNKQQEHMHRGRCDVTFSTADVAMKVQSKMWFSWSLKKRNIAALKRRGNTVASVNLWIMHHRKNTHQQCMCSYEWGCSSSLVSPPACTWF